MLSQVQVLNSGGAPSLHHQCKGTTETWGCRTPLRSMRHSSCLHPSAPPPAAATAVRHASPPRPRKHTAAPFKSHRWRWRRVAFVLSCFISLLVVAVLFCGCSKSNIVTQRLLRNVAIAVRKDVQRIMFINRQTRPQTVRTP